MNMNLSLTTSWRISSRPRFRPGRDTSSSELCREALRLMERGRAAGSRETQPSSKAWQEGITAATLGELDFKALKQEVHARLAASKA